MYKELLLWCTDSTEYDARVKFLDNTHNKNDIIHLLSSVFQKDQITVELCDNDADTSIVKAVEISEPHEWLLGYYSILFFRRR